MAEVRVGVLHHRGDGLRRGRAAGDGGVLTELARRACAPSLASLKRARLRGARLHGRSGASRFDKARRRAEAAPAGAPEAPRRAACELPPPHLHSRSTPVLRSRDLPETPYLQAMPHRCFSTPSTRTTREQQEAVQQTSMLSGAGGRAPPHVSTWAVLGDRARAYLVCRRTRTHCALSARRVCP